MIRLNETAPDIMPKNNIVIIQCLFRNMLTSKQMNFSTSIISPKLRRGLDFEIYYQLDGEVVKKLLSTTLLVSNCVNAETFTGQQQIMRILEPYQPFAGFLTDSYGDQITGDVMSDATSKILRQCDGQGENFSVFRFSFIHAGYAACMTQLFQLKNQHEILQPPYYGYYKGRTSKLDALKIDGQKVPASEIITHTPFLISGYWDGFKWEPQQGAFVKCCSVAVPFIPALKHRYNDNKISLFYDIVKTDSDIDYTLFKNTLETAVSVSMLSNRDFRTKINEASYIEYLAGMLDEAMEDKTIII